MPGVRRPVADQRRTRPMRDRKTNQRTLFLSAFASVLIGLSATDFMPTKLVWNASKSVPKGLYYITHKPPARNDLVLVQLPERARTLADQRRYLPRDVPAIKRVTALSGDFVCRFARTIFVNGIVKRTAQRTDAALRKMSGWRGCMTLKDDQVFLLADHPNSFDGRYFGVTSTNDIIGIADPIWTDAH